MSHYTSVKLKFVDTECLLQALTTVKPAWKVTLYEEAQHLYGYQGDRRHQKAHIVIARKSIDSASNDIGFLREDDGTYTAIVSDYDRGILNWETVLLPQLKQEYGLLVAEKNLTAQGFTVEREVSSETGRVRLRGRKPQEVKKTVVVRR